LTGRKKEIKILNQLLRKNESSLVAVYGRRRIGKTYLIREVYKSNKDTCLYFEFTGSYDKSKDVQITNFLTSINVWFAQETEKEIKTWSQAFSFFTSVMIKKIKECPDKKIILFFDEMPWIDKSTKGGFPSALGHFWNSFIEHYKNFVVVLCGSNAAWIKKKLLNENVASFNHRFNETIPLKPFDLEETKEYLLNELKYNVDDKTIVELYMIFGGVAKYLSYIKNDKTLEDNISRIFFSSESLMFEEYNNLFQSLFGSDEK
jgi:AAA+ ATPase superfamily predicted ATPase